MLSLKKQRNYLILGCILGGLSFLLVYGIQVLDVTYDAWLLNGQDLNQHYIGWTAFRSTTWSFPIGLHNGLTFPSSISVLYTDSIPLFAFVGKVVRSFLPGTFQYFGIFGLLTMMLNGAASAWIVSKFHKNVVTCSMLTLLFVLAPVILQRLYVHTALSAHFLILFSIGIWLYYKDFESTKRAAVCWSFLGILCVLIQSYFLFMVGGIMCGYLLMDLLLTKDWKKTIVVMMSFMGSSLLVTYIVGGFSGGASLGSIGYGLYSANLNCLFNPMGYSRVLPDLPSGAGQYEGFSYLGLGGIILVLIGLVTAVSVFAIKCVQKKIRQVLKRRYCQIISWGIVSLVFTILAITNNIVFNNTAVFYSPLPTWTDSFTAIIRSSGRFIWFVMYFSLVFSVYMLKKWKKEMLIIVASVLIIGVQIFDLSDRLIDIHEKYNVKEDYKEDILTDGMWDEIISDHNKVLMYPVLEMKSEMDKHLYYDYANLIKTVNGKMNYFYFSRPFDDCITISNNFIKRKISKSKLDYKALYVLNPLSAENFRDIPGINLYLLNDQIIGTFHEYKTLEKYSTHLLNKRNKEICLDMVDAKNSSFFMKNGWYGYERGCAFSRDKAFLEISMKNVKKASITIQYMPMEGESETLVYIDSQYIGTITKTEENHEVIIGVPEHLLNNGRHEVCLSTDKLIEHQVSRDTKVGIAVKKIIFNMNE